MPVQIRRATQHMAMFSVDADAAQRMIDYSGLQVCRYRPEQGRRRPHADALRRRRPRAVPRVRHQRDGEPARVDGHRAARRCSPRAPSSTICRSTARSRGGGPVDLGLSEGVGGLHAFAIRAPRSASTCSVDGQFAVGMDFAPGLPVPSALTSKTQVHPTYSHLDGVTRETAGEMTTVRRPLPTRRGAGPSRRTSLRAGSSRR